MPQQVIEKTRSALKPDPREEIVRLALANSNPGGGWLVNLGVP